jgi:hypothetical protein
MRSLEKQLPNGAGSRSHDDELARVLDDYLAAVEAGRPVDLDDWATQHPAIADRLRTCVKGLQLGLLIPAEPEVKAGPRSAISKSCARSAAAAWVSYSRPSSTRSDAMSH